MKYLKSLFFLVAIFVLFISCYKEPEMLKIDNVKIKKLHNDIVYLDVRAKIFNPNGFTIKAKNIKLKFVIHDTLAGTGRVKSTFNIKPKSTKKINLSTKLLLPALSNILPKIIKKDSFPVKVYVKADVTSLQIPLSTKTVKYFKSKDLIKSFLNPDDFNQNIKIKRVELLETGIDSTQLRLDLLFDNTLPFDYKIKSIASKIYNNEHKDELMGISKLSKSVLIKKNHHKLIFFNIKINNLNSVKGMFQNILHKKKNVFLHTDILLYINKYAFKIPFETNFEIPKPKLF